LETLQRAGLTPHVIVSGVDESVVHADTTTALVQQLALLKALAVAERVEGPALVLGCDSMLELDGRALGKPADADEARARWRDMRGRSGILHTGHALIGPNGSRCDTASTTVHFADVADNEIDAYVATGEPLHVAGAFTIDGLGGWFVEAIDGDHHNVVGLSLPLLRHMLHELGYELSDLGYGAPPRSTS
jgi:septum formation protein